MNKKVAIILALTAVLILAAIGGIIFAISQLKFEGKSTLTTNGETYTTYTGGTYYTELNDHIKVYYTAVNSLDLAAATASQIIAVVDEGKAALNNTETFMASIDNVDAAGVSEINAAVTQWINTQRNLLTNQYVALANLVGEDGEVSSQEEADQANALIREIDNTAGAATDDLNNAMEAFFNANNR